MNNVCLITGASGGIGAAIAYEMAALGYSLYLHYHKNEEQVKMIAARCINEYGVHATTVQGNLANKQGVEHLLNQMTEDVDVFIHNSGNSFYGLLTDMSFTEMEEMIFLHLTSAILISKRLLPFMTHHKQGNIIVISSIWGLTGASCEVVYSSVKGGLNSFVKALAKEVGLSNIRVNGVAPGAIETKMMETFDEEERLNLCEEIPLGRLGDPEEVANVVSFLVSKKSSYISGQIISVNGAWYC